LTKSSIVHILNPSTYANIHAPLVHFLYLQTQIIIPQKKKKKIQTQIIKAILGFQGLVPLRSAPLDVPRDWRRLLSQGAAWGPYPAYVILYISRPGCNFSLSFLWKMLRTCLVNHPQNFHFHFTSPKNIK
jgi:hypothetical protein